MRLLVLLFVISSAQASEKFVEQMCLRYKVKDCAAVKAIAWVESNFRHVVNENDVGSPSYGIMQVKCIAARHVGLKYSCEQLRDKVIAARFGIKFLESKNKLYNEIDDVFAAYNANRPIICRRRIKGKCYPNEYVNHKYVYNVMRRYRYEKFKNSKNNSYVLLEN